MWKLEKKTCAHVPYCSTFHFQKQKVPLMVALLILIKKHVPPHIRIFEFEKQIPLPLIGWVF